MVTFIELGLMSIIHMLMVMLRFSNFPYHCRNRLRVQPVNIKSMHAPLVFHITLLQAPKAPLRLFKGSLADYKPITPIWQQPPGIHFVFNIRIIFTLTSIIKFPVVVSGLLFFIFYLFIYTSTRFAFEHNKNTSLQKFTIILNF